MEGDKVTVVANPSNDASRTKDSDGAQPIERKSAMINGVSNGTDTTRPQDESTSYATAVSSAASDGLSKRSKTTRLNGSTYPELPEETSKKTHEKGAYRSAGIRFAPFKIPFTRRMQTLAVFFHCTFIVMIVSSFWFIIANPLSWPIVVPYLIHLSLSTASTDGNLSYRSEWLRSLPLWRLFAGYFPMELHKTYDLSPDRKYIMGYHPHGIISHGAWCAFATNALGFSTKFPGITNTLLTLDSNFRLPFYRDWLLLLGVRSVSKESIWNTLTKGGPNNDGQGRAVTIVVGGARESLEAQPGRMRLILHGRKGFVKMALRTGADLVPVIGFGENDIYDQLSPQTHPKVHKFQMFVLKVFKFTLPAMHGRGLLNYDVGLMPYRRPVHVVIGKPIESSKSKSEQPSQEDIDRYHELYVHEVEALYESYKDRFTPNRTEEMSIIT